MDPSVKDVSNKMKLEGSSNYMLWSYRIQMILRKEDLWPPTAATSNTCFRDEVPNKKIDGDIKLAPIHIKKLVHINDSRAQNIVALSHAHND